ncbi:DUF3021 domain-containing protein [Secundilactobacillus folii]|uniref:DUF3021 family protein n=1 Tax=Secundilactobacillus folii TaxID=2678357 RepID=A0A7X3C3G1_9LACO|nr:DUF3021 domain-containing protein [Secundilactobacillus folii]MTV82259.1 DUF3021 family protein [Secundilactobacillus folii]
MKFSWRVIQVSLIGGLIGILIGFLLALISSVLNQSPVFLPSTPTFVAQYQNNLTATLVSVGLWALMGIVFSATSSIIFAIDRWSITHQTVIHFLITYVLFTPLAVTAGWFPVKYYLISYSIEFLIIYFITWLVSMQIAKATVRKLNRLVSKEKQ